jgi:hypothetical protein
LFQKDRFNKLKGKINYFHELLNEIILAALRQLPRHKKIFISLFYIAFGEIKRLCFFILFVHLYFDMFMTTI